MAKRSKSRDQRMRDLLAQEAGRLMAEGGLKDFFAAKRKAAERLGATDTRNMPSNEEIEAALRRYQALFYGERQAEQVASLRRHALEAMRFFADFEPRLVGSVLKGTADWHSEITLQVFADPPEEVQLFLLDKGIPYRHSERRLRYHEDKVELFPAYRFVVDGAVEFEVTVIPRDRLKRPPLSSVDGRPMARATLREVEALVGAA
jgi:hypothetical protein